MKKIAGFVVLAVFSANGVLAGTGVVSPPIERSATGNQSSPEPDRAISVSVLPGYPERDTSRMQWLEAGSEPVTYPEAATTDASDPIVSTTISGVAMYRHAITGEYLPCSGALIQLAYDVPENYNDEDAWTSCYADLDGRFTLGSRSTYMHRCYSYRIYVVTSNSAANPNYDYPFDGWEPSWRTDWFLLCGDAPPYDLGYIYPYWEDSSRMAHVAANLLRNRTLMAYLTGDAVLPVTVEYDHDGTYPDYTSNTHMYVDWDTAWSDGRVAAQYARLWMAQFCATWDDDCGAGRECSAWCAGTAQAAYTQGLARWFGDIVPHRYPAYFDYTAVSPYDYEDLARCGTDYADPNLTPGFFAAVLHDIQDSPADLHEDFGSEYPDAVSLGHDGIIAAAKNSAHEDPLHFLRWMRDAHSDITEDLWETCMNSGYDIDELSPGLATGITASHVVGVPSPDGTIEFNWVRPTDDASGVAGYSIAMATRVLAPENIMNYGNFTSYDTNQLAPGNWYFNIRAVDRSGHWSDDYAHVGPFTILEPDPIDLQPYARTGWDYPVVPRPTGDANAGFCPTPTSLVGGALVYLSTCGTNSGGAATPDKFSVQFLVDGQALGNPYGAGPVNGGEDYWILNKSTHIAGGRHTLEAFHESGEIYAEQIETNNRWSAQWAWQPPVLTVGVPILKTAPPDPEGGWEALPAAVTAYANCEGFRFASRGDWRLVSMTPLDAADDYDLRLYAPSTGPTDGFAGSLEASKREAGQLEAVLVHGRTAGFADWDVGVVNRGRLLGAADYELELITASPFAFGDSLAVAQAEGEMLLLREVAMAPENVGWITITVDVRPATQKVRWYWFDSTFDTGALMDRTALWTTDATGRARRNVQVTQAGYCGLVVARDPIDGTAPDTLIIEVEPGLPDMIPLKPTGWHAPLVPRPAQDGTDELVALPDTLYGDTHSTYYNAAVRNASVVPVLTDFDIVVDGMTRVGATRANMMGFDDATIHMSIPDIVRGGRHTLSLRCDPDNEFEELLESNNDFGEQYVWGPVPLVYGVPVTRIAPPDPYGGWADLPPDSTRYYNCDGLRLPAAGGHFGAVAVMPGDSCSVDVRLHEPGVGAKSGFGESLVQSHWGADHSSYVLVNYDLAGARPLDAGLLNFGGSLACVAEAVEAATLAFDGDETYGPYTLPAGRTLDLYALPLTAGVFSISLENESGTVDWGLGLHPADRPFMTKSDTVDSAQFYYQGPGIGESFVVEVPAAGWYCLAVWKVGSADLGLAGEYTLSVRPGATAVGDDLPRTAVSALVSIRPNPFNPSTRLLLDIAAPDRVRLDVFDARGRRIRVLVDESLPAGRREFTWDGRDDSGRTMSSGTYFARFAVGDVVQTAKMVLLK